MQNQFIELGLFNTILTFIAAVLMGMSKAGLKGIDVLTVTIMSFVFGAKASTGVVLPLLLIGDVMSVFYYNRHTKWYYLKKLIPWVLIGLIIAAYYGQYIPESLFKKIMGAIILISIVWMIWLERKQEIKIPKNTWFSGVMGILTGFTTMIGNLAGPFANLYFLAMRLPKYNFIGTSAWLFFIVNLIKVPLQVFLWKNITEHTLIQDSLLAPFVLIGFFVGIKIINRISQDVFRLFIIVFTIIGVLFIFL